MAAASLRRGIHGPRRRIQARHHCWARRHSLSWSCRKNVLRPERAIFYRDAQFLAKHTDRVPKFALPSPYIIMRRYWSPTKSIGAYPTRESFIEHLSEILHLEALAVVKA